MGTRKRARVSEGVTRVISLKNLEFVATLSAHLRPVCFRAPHLRINSRRIDAKTKHSGAHAVLIANLVVI